MSTPMFASSTLVRRFWAKVDASAGLLGCWLWMGARNPRGYGSFDHAGAHRFALEMALGRPLDPGMQACHSCDNPPCVNPAHLFEGTHRDNVADRDVKGRQAKGERSGARLHPGSLCRGDSHPARRIPGLRAGVRNGRARLTEESVREIRRRVEAGGERWADIAASFGISKGAVAHIAARRSWQHVI